MAEPAGLALGTVALASLFSTCIELIEYFELGKGYEYDYELACVKLSLLKTRLDTWGHSLGVDDDNYDDRELKTHRPRERIVIQRSLQGIAGIFGNAELLKDKYCLLPRKARGINVVLARGGQAPVSESDRRLSFSSRFPSISFYRRSTTWAIRDKQKFDALIADLDFLISNLEKVLSQLRLAPIPSSEMSNNSDSPDLVRRVSNGTDPRATPSAHVTNYGAPRTLTPPYSPAYVQVQTSQQPVFNSGGGEQSTSRTHTEPGYTFSVEKVEGRSAVFHGTSGGAALSPAPQGQVVKFRVGITTDDARSMGGAMSDASLDSFFNATARDSRAQGQSNTNQAIRGNEPLRGHTGR